MLVQFPQSRHVVARPFLFTSPKCRVAIPVHDVLVRCALEQASLDPSVCEIQFRNGPKIECPPVSLAGVVLRKEGGAFLLRVYEARPERSDEDDSSLNFVLERHGLRLLERDAQDIQREPLFSNARAVWSRAGRHISLMDRLKISAALELGPQSINHLERQARLKGVALDAVCALACENLVRLNLQDAFLGPQTIVLGP